MNNPEYEARIEDVKRRAHGRWTEILGSLGVGEQTRCRRLWRSSAARFRSSSTARPQRARTDP